MTRAEADDARDLAPLGFRQVGVLLGHDLEGALLGLVEQVGELDGFAGAGLEGLAVVAEDGAEPDVRELASWPSGCQRRKTAKSCWKWSCWRPSVT